MYGVTVPRSTIRTDRRSVVGEIETSMAGNVILRIGRENDIGWSQTEHVVLAPEEAQALASELLRASGVRLAPL